MFFDYHANDFRTEEQRTGTSRKDWDANASRIAIVSNTEVI